MMKNIFTGLILLLQACLLNAGLIQESAYLEHITIDTDRDLYIAGENLWFHVSCTDQHANPDSVISKIIYIELFDQKFNSISRAKFLIIDGNANGHFTIPDDINTGNYFLRAYTQYSRNFPSYLNCTSLITILNPLKPLPQDEIVRDEEMMIVPEGGSLTTGRACRIAVRLTPALAKSTTGILITDETGNRITSAKPFENGLCLLVFTPGNNKSYNIIIQQQDGKEIIKQIPQTIDPSDKKTGEVTKIVNYVPAQKQIILSSDKSVYAARELVNVNCNVPAGIRNPFVKVTSPDGKFHRKDLLPWYVAYNPALLSNCLDHMVSISDSLKMQIDIVKILYSAITGRKENMAATEKQDLNWLPEIRDAGITGKVLDKITGKPLKDIIVFASVADRNNQVHMYKTGSDGGFYFTLNHLTGIHNVFISPKPSDSLKMQLLINNDFEDNYPESAGIVPFILDSAETGLINRLYRNARLNTIFPKFAAHDERNIYYYPLPKAVQEKAIRLKDYIEMPVMTEVFSEIVPFVTMKKNNDRYYFQVFDDRLGATYDEPLVLLDGIPVFDITGFMQVSPELIDSIEVTNRTTYLGNFTVNGIISIKSNTSNFAGIKMPEASSFIEFHGTTPESFPVFPDHMNGKNDRNPDFRTLLFWNRLNGNENKISFSASDYPGEYEISVTGNQGGIRYTGSAEIRVGE